MMFDVPKILDIIKTRNAKIVGLQFPEGLKRQGPALAKEVEDKSGALVIISGDPCYGACDIDEGLLGIVDVLFHFGHSRMMDDERIVFMEYYHDVDVERAVINALPLLGRKVGVTTTVQHIHKLDEIARTLKNADREPIIAKGDSRVTYPGQVLGCNFSAVPEGVDSILFVGTGNFHPMGMRLARRVPVVAADPFTGEARLVDIEKIVKQRYAIMAKAMDAKKWGIIVGMKPGQRRMGLAKHIKDLAGDAVLISIREITPDRLQSFKVDAFVSTACPRIAIDDAGRFPAPVLTPIEFEILKGKRKWEDMAFDEIKGG
ncbi:diphthamide biosynthesis enzyme Dph2 [Methanocella conradii]|uniref:diphthamide biosynthesis enzyme Dph2 n=1 Tax=Methanocella conradii TaxID=1175444 RepID=UPI00157BCDDC|nr:diphthamide biosynthesis enzyme Dph2 [Methanocella conradii]